MFRRAQQSHVCAPAMTVEEYFSTGPAFERPIFEAVMKHLKSVGPVHIEPVSVGIFLKRSQSFSQLRPKQRWVAMSFTLDREVRHPKVTRKVVEWNGRYHHVANLAVPDDLDDQLREYLTEAYLTSPV